MIFWVLIFDLRIEWNEVVFFLGGLIFSGMFFDFVFIFLLVILGGWLFDIFFNRFLTVWSPKNKFFFFEDFCFLGVDFCGLNGFLLFFLVLDFEVFFCLFLELFFVLEFDFIMVGFNVLIFIKLIESKILIL